MNKFVFVFLSFCFIAFQACDSESALGGSVESQNGISGSITRFATLGDYMYTLNPNQLQTFDITDPSKPTLLSELETDYGLETIFIYEDRIYLGSRTGLFILGLDNPAEPNLLSQTAREDEFFGACDPVVVRDNYAYSTIKTIVNVCGNVNTRSALLIYEVSDPSNPVLTQSFDLFIPNGLGYTDQFLYVCSTGAETLRVFDISNPANVVERPDLDYPIEEPFDIIVDNDRMIVSSTDKFFILGLAEDGSIADEAIISK